MITKNLFIYWAQGFDSAPEIVKICYETWKTHNKETWKIIELDDTNINNYLKLEEYIPDIAKKNMMLCHKADIIRVLLLDKYGGIWVDATTYCVKPLDSWLNKYAKTGFFAFDKPGNDRLLSNWFLYSEKNNYIIQLWKQRILDYWEKKKCADHYYRHLYIFGELYNENNVFKIIWDATPKISAYTPHLLQAAGLYSVINEEVKKYIEDQQAPLYKLTHKFDKEKVVKGCILYNILLHLCTFKTPT